MEINEVSQWKTLNPNMEDPENPSESLSDGIGKEKISSIRRTISEINSLIEEREQLSQLFYGECEKIKSEINNFLIENSSIKFGDNSTDAREFFRERNDLRYKKIELAELQLNEKVSCWKDIALLKKELRILERELNEREERAKVFQNFLEN